MNELSTIHPWQLSMVSSCAATTAATTRPKEIERHQHMFISTALLRPKVNLQCQQESVEPRSQAHLTAAAISYPGSKATSAMPGFHGQPSACHGRRRQQINFFGRPVDICWCVAEVELCFSRDHDGRTPTVRHCDLRAELECLELLSIKSERERDILRSVRSSA